MIPWLGATPVFPPLARALTEPNGLLAAGGELSPGWLLAAYRRGIFPWFMPGEPILWWSPNPRTVLVPTALHVPRSLAKVLRHRGYAVTFDRAFADVMAGCAAPRDVQGGTWITDEMRAAYGDLHRLGHAHSAECWIDGQLAGGLYGVAIGRMFYGESMFARAPDASKIAFVHLVRWLAGQGFELIDCQMRTDHLARFGASEIDRDDFVARLGILTDRPGLPGPWDYHCDNPGRTR
ncbi:leucyl/phenylalanyl-tRNA--protein transferase [Chitiniphilus eburneus]|uniref:Leucyl/phenylalanyl-tRNA--protein transferase n=1 Tax=Chitiniphilus eburneus TaxID=2571148 RepID=A0A4U0PBZ3_9NEIS|nr:leucyl/phenylalanyl-tRNA--protein transferase [Chitiniphilus eburneus]TJZ65211.1 leucyl/phenylalanyl-tRNA--protein transferase [Chitiniphilus eburneus]